MHSKYYKVLDPRGISPTTNFDYSPYLPSRDGPGAWLPKIEDAKIRKSGYYASRYWNIWYSDGMRIYEVELDEKFVPDENGVEYQVCSPSMRLVRDVTEELLNEYFAHDSNHAASGVTQACGKWNLGFANTGSGNTGSHNCGDFNVGNRNSGKRNLGDFNTGDSNSGIDNVGDDNFGSSNAGSHNRGHRNCGDLNIGSYNSGHSNCGHKNSGSFNTGNSNTGNWNIGDRHSGFFNTLPEKIYMFNKPTNLRAEDVKMPPWLNSPDIKKSFEAAPTEQILATINLPNFDYSIFERITGISKADFERKLGGL